MGRDDLIALAWTLAICAAAWLVMSALPQPSMPADYRMTESGSRL